MFNSHVRWLRRGGAALIAAFTLAACNDKEPLYEVEGAAVLYSRVDNASAGGWPVGEVSIGDYRLIQFDATVSDAFGRTTLANDGIFGRGTSSVGVGPHGSQADPRIPVPVRATGVGNFFIYGPDYWGEAVYNFYNPWFNDVTPEPGVRYAFGLARYGVQVNGRLDTEEMLLDGEITEPDELILIDPNPDGYLLQGSNYAEWDDGSEDCREPVVGANPMILASATSVSGFDGTAIDVIMCAGPWAASGYDAANFPLARNRHEVFGANAYNYFVIYEADVVTGEPILDRIVSRRQVGPDLTVDGAGVVNNALAPFPTAAMSEAQLLAGPGGAGAPSELTLSVFDLDALSGRVYQAWLYNPATQSLVQARGDLVVEEEIRTVTDAGDLIIEYDTVATATDVATFDGKPGEGRYRHVFTVSDASLSDGARVGEHVLLFLSVEAGEATSPSEVRPVWRQFTNQNETPDNYFDDMFIPGAVRFGQYGMTQPSRIFEARGSGRVDFYGADIRAIMQNLSRPPRGFYYHAWLVNGNTGAFTSLGELTTEPPSPASLRDADMNDQIPGVTPDGIVGAAATATVAQAGCYNLVQVTLEGKDSPATAMSPTLVLQGPVPDAVQQSCPN